ncbi:cilia- and flagella-associated protein 47-like [Solea solea]|uniref:cilia- and flagella-associated protein 47-like n=1 Tax=Solea solea TaxID=90069 RepID=UPI00272B91C0|nr:cilia- and flagella-associated protein 47-like [Solea solea]
MAGSGSVIVDPPFIEFNDVRVGQVYRTTVTATNVGKTSRRIVIKNPALKELFKFIAAAAATVGPPAPVAPGLSVSGVLQFTPQKDEVVTDRLLICSDDVETIEIPLRGFPTACSLLMDSVLDFGCVAASRQIICKHHPIENQGSAPGVFLLQYDGDPSVKLSPSSGVIAAGAIQWLQVQLRTDRPMHVHEKAVVKLQNRSAAVFNIKAKVVDQRLELFDMKGDPLSCLWFGPLYFGTSRVETVVLKNNGPQVCDWICLLQDSAAGTEVGLDLQKSTDAALLERKESGKPATQVFVCVPEQGRLGPNEKTTVTVRFSPICDSTKRWHDCLVSRQDYCLFLLFESAESRHGFTHCKGSSSVELAVTGSGLPVSLVPNPSDTFDFPVCVKGQRADLLCVLQNHCPQLPINFHFRKLAQFSAKPSKGTINPGQCQDVILSYTARQLGSFKVCQVLDVLGYVLRGSDNMDGRQLELGSFLKVNLHLSAVCHSETEYSGPKLNPAVTNATGSRNIRSSGMGHCQVWTHAAHLNTKKGETIQHAEDEHFMPTSIKIVSADRHFRTIFGGAARFPNLRANYAFTDEEKEWKWRDQHIYVDFIKQHRRTRLARIKKRQQGKGLQEVDIGLIPSQGLVPPKLRTGDGESSKSSETNLNHTYESKRTKCHCLTDITSITPQEKTQSSVEVGAVPSNSQEMADCSRTLTALELCKVVIDPLLVDFGKVCEQSVFVRKLELINRLSVYVWVQLDVDCPELLGSSPLSHILPPYSHSTLPLTFQSNKLGHVYRPVTYSVNKQHPGQILVLADVVPVALELSTTLLVLRPNPTLFAQSGYRSSVTLRNHHNHATEFTWRPVVTERGILFSIRPATGTVEPYRELECEVVWHPSFSSPAEGDFDLCIYEGSTQRLHCVAKVGSPCVQLAENLLIFGSVPLNMPSIRTAILHNTGQNHAYYRVLDVCPLPGMMVSPREGVVPSGGQTVLKILFNPDSVIKFDTRVQIAMRKMKSIELRVRGTVESPNVDFSVSHFQFYMVHACSQRVIPFTMTNHSPAAARVTFNLSHFADFTLQLPQPSTIKESGVGLVEVQGNQTVDCSLTFSPTQPAGFDFDLPLMVNGEKWSTASSSPVPTSSYSSISSTNSAVSWKHLVQSLSHSVTMATQRSLHIQATVVQAPLELSPSSLHFHVEPLISQSDAYTKTVELKAGCEQSIWWRGVISQRLHWWFKCSTIAAPTEGKRDGELCTVTPSSGSLGPSQSICLAVSIRPEAIRTVSDRLIRLSLHLYLGDEGEEEMGEEEGHEPSQVLAIIITVQPLNITIHPPQILFSPVPLKTNAMTTLTLLAEGYPSGTRITAEVDEVELEDGTKIQPVSIVFPEGNSITARNQEQGQSTDIQSQEAMVTSVTCSVCFCSAVPLSVCTTITFIEQHFNNRFKVTLFAVADNCLLTVWPYMAFHRSEQQIVLKTGATAVEAILQHRHTPSPSPGPTSSSSTYDPDSWTYTDSPSGSFPDSDTMSGQTSTDDEMSTRRHTPDNLGVPEFPAVNSEEGIYYQTVLMAVERWFSFFGWPNGPHPISVPHTLRRTVAKPQTHHSAGRTYSVIQTKDCRSVLDMLHHLTGKKIPGIPLCDTVSKDTDQRIDQLLQQHEAVLAFLRKKGAFLLHIRPEYLLDVQEFKHWCSMQSNKGGNRVDYTRVDYESLSKRSWTDVLLQIYKVLVLCRLSKTGLSTGLNQENIGGILPVNSQPLASNVYSAYELRLLSWLNKHYESMRKSVFGTGEIPSARWIVNFDLDFTDGLVLAALLASYCPYLICSHFRRMYATPSTLEQILHNNIIVAQALAALYLNTDIQPTDLSDPNPVQMLMLCVHLYERLPHYLPMQTITLSGSLRSTFSHRVQLNSPSCQPVKYQAFLFGKNAHLFSLPRGSIVSIPPKASRELTVQYCCSFMQPMEAVLLLVSSPAFRVQATTLTYNLKTQVSHITPTNSVKCVSPCYVLREIQLPITNPFRKEAQFRVVLVESTYNPLEPEKKNVGLIEQASYKASTENMTADRCCGDGMKGGPSALSGEGREFLSATRAVCLKSNQSDILNIHYLPFSPGTKYCSVLLVCPQVGDMVYMVKATADLPLPFPLCARPSPNIDSRPQNSVISLHCKVQQVCEEVVCVPLVNMAWERALAIWGQQNMSADEHRRRTLTQTLYSSSVRAASASKLFKQQAQTMRGVRGSAGHCKVITYSVEVSLPQYFTLPKTIEMPINKDTNVSGEIPADCSSVEIPVRFQADREGQFTCQVVLKSSCDTRVFMMEALVTSQTQGGSIHLDFTSPAHSSVKQGLP